MTSRSKPIFPERRVRFSGFGLTQVGLLLLTGFVLLQSAWTATDPRERSAGGANLSTLSTREARRIADLEDQLAVLKRRIEQLERVPLAPAQAPKVAPLPATSDLEPAPRVPQARAKTNDGKTENPETLAVNARAEVSAARETFEAHILAEDVDPSWSVRQERQILDDVGGGNLGRAYLVDAECRSTLCRVELEHPEGLELDRLMMEVMAKPSFAGRKAFIEQDVASSGTGRMTVFLARAGQPLPRVQAPN